MDRIEGEEGRKMGAEGTVNTEYSLEEIREASRISAETKAALRSMIAKYKVATKDYGRAFTQKPIPKEARKVGKYVLGAGKPAEFEERLGVRENSTSIIDHQDEAKFTEANLTEGGYTLERALFETIQNAERNDSKGNWYAVEVLIGDKWTDLRNLDEEEMLSLGGQIQAVRVCDDGEGYRIDNLTAFGSDKDRVSKDEIDNLTAFGSDKDRVSKDEEEPSGMYGTGVKLSDRKFVGEDIRVVRHSRNWRATSFVSTTDIGDDKEEKNVGYDISFYENFVLGSVVELSKRDGLPTELIRALINLRKRYLPLDSTYEERLLIYTNEIALLKPRENESGVMYLHGRPYEFKSSKTPFLFSYDIYGLKPTSHERKYLDKSEATERIRQALSQVKDPEIFVQILAKAEGGGDCQELDMGGIEPNEAFKEALKRHFKIENSQLIFFTEKLRKKERIDDGFWDAMVAWDVNDADGGVTPYLEEMGNEVSNEGAEEILKNKGYKAINIGKSKFVRETLEKLGIKSAGEALKSARKPYKDNPKLRNKYSNEDFQSLMDRLLVFFDAVDDESKEFVVLLRNNNDGSFIEMNIGEYLGNMPSNYTPYNVVVRTGNLVIAENTIEELVQAAYSSGVTCSITNGKYEFTSTGKKAFETQWEHSAPENFKLVISLTNNEANSVRELREKSLKYKEGGYSPVETTAAGEIISIDDKDAEVIYVNGVVKKGLARMSAIMSYNLKNEELEIKDQVAEIISLSNKEEVVEKVLKTGGDARLMPLSFCEYFARPKNKELWLKVFRRIYGENTVVNNLQKSPYGAEALEVIRNSKIKSVRLHPELTKLMIDCGIGKMSDAVAVKKFVPAKRVNETEIALTKLLELANEVVKRALPQGVTHQDLRPIIATRLYNEFGQRLKDQQGMFIDPFLEDPRVFIDPKILKRKKVTVLVARILNVLARFYRDSMPGDEYSRFHNAVVERVLFDPQFFMSISGGLMKASDIEQNILEEIERIRKLEPPARDHEDGEEDPGDFSDSDDYISKRKINKVKRSRMARIATITTLAASAIIALFVLGGNIRDKIFPQKSPAKIAQKISSEKKQSEKIIKRDGFEREEISRDAKLTVGGEKPEKTKERSERTKKTFRTERIVFENGTIDKGEYYGTMVERTAGEYHGKGWYSSPEAPEFPGSQRTDVEKIYYVHRQKVGENEKEVNIRRIEGGVVDPSSIAEFRANGETEKAEWEALPNGEYKVKLRHEDTILIVYQTQQVKNWGEIAASVTDEDYKTLPQDTYAYYTKTPRLPLGDMKFKARYSFNIGGMDKVTVSNLAELVELLNSLKPYDRTKVLLRFIEQAGYYTTEDEQVLREYSRFLEGKTEFEDHLQFVIQSTNIEKEFAGDCDVHNSIFGLILRYVGIPSRQILVFTNSGVPHTSTEVFFPGAGWIALDATVSIAGTGDAEENQDAIDARPVSAEEIKKQINARILEETERKRGECQFYVPNYEAVEEQRK